MNYYLYRHISLKDGRPFYIGIGKKLPSYKTYETEYFRAFRIKGRNNPYWHHIVNKYGYEVEILFESDNMEEIKDKEKEFIKLYGRKDNKTGLLVNLSDGGDGSLNPSCETRIKMSLKAKGRYKIGNHNLNIGCTENSIKAILKPVKCELTNGTFVKDFNSIKEAQEFTGVDFRNISAICYGKRKSGNGYVFKFIKVNEQQ